MGAPFSITIDSSKLSRGFRPSKRMPRNSGFLVECAGGVGRDGVLQCLDELTQLATDTITDSFPYPQLFLFTNFIIVCSQTKIYEYVSGALVPKLTVAAGSTWSAVDLYDHIYMSNGKIAVVRSVADKTYSETTELPIAMTICNFQGQVLIGGPDVIAPGANLTIKADSIDVAVTQHGDWA